MPYRNALRDNFRRFMDVNDAEMRMYAQQRMQQYQPQGMYAAADASALSMDDIGYDEQGNLVILSEQPQYQEDLSGVRFSMPPRPQVEPTGYNPEAGLNAIQRRRQAIAEALEY
jgi:hypothetical protein